jgi:UDP-N-acetyl-D-glucosamine dehydrogenase
MPFYPGPGLGGHCIPIDPSHLSWKARQYGFECRFIELAGQINSSMPQYVVERIADALNTIRKPINGSRVHLVGVAYKRDVNDMRESPALDVLELLAKRGAQLTYSDPFVPELNHGGQRLSSSQMPIQPLGPTYLGTKNRVGCVRTIRSCRPGAAITQTHSRPPW